MATAQQPEGFTIQYRAQQQAGVQHNNSNSMAAGCPGLDVAQQLQHVQQSKRFLGVGAMK
jgi:hypothetical protein